MRFRSVNDIGFSDIPVSSVDAVIFCSGFESRCIHIAEKALDKLTINGSVVVFGFDDQIHTESRKQSDKFYKENIDCIPVLLSGDEYDQVFILMNKLFSNNHNKQISILFDYTSMTRQWYAAILSWCKFQRRFDEITLFATYSVGEYINEPSPMVIQEITSLPDFSGSTLAKTSSTLIFGLGFEGEASLCVIERLEPTNVYTFIAKPAASTEAYDRSLKVNNYIIQHLSRAHLEYSLFSVENTFRGLSELLVAQPENANITVVPMGPKPHILATLLLGIRYPKLTCIRVSGRGKKGENVHAEGQVIATKITFL